MSDDLIVLWYDEAVAEGKEDGRKVSDSIDAVIARVEQDPHGADVPADSELRAAWVASTIRGERNSRARKRLPIFQHVHDRALRTGTTDGLDKSLRYWTVEDWLDVLGASAQNVAAAIEADKSLRDAVNPIISVYARRGATHLEDML